MTPCNDSHENNSSEPSGRTLRHAFGKTLVIERNGCKEWKRNQPLEYFRSIWLWVKNEYPKWNPGKSAVPIPGGLNF